MAAEGDNIITYIYRGGRGEVIPDDATQSLWINRSQSSVRGHSLTNLTSLRPFFILMSKGLKDWHSSAAVP
eukprot:scaffold28179_cov72-Skeletonema_dohrnii-CCMP3373.AAC.2